MKNRFKELCTTLGYNQQTLAEKLSIDVRKLRSYMYETKNFPVEFLISLKNNLDVNINWLLTGTGEMFVSQSSKENTITEKISKIGERFSILQNKYNYTDKDIAQILGIYEYEYIDLKKGKKEPTFNILNHLKQNLDISVDWLLYGDN